MEKPTNFLEEIQGQPKDWLFDILPKFLIVIVAILITIIVVKNIIQFVF